MSLIGPISVIRRVAVSLTRPFADSLWRALNLEDDDDEEDDYEYRLSRLA